MLLVNECYKEVGKVDIGPLQRIADQLKFVNSEGECAWVTDPKFAAPSEFRQLMQSLNLEGERIRQFCRKLIPGQGIPPHVDDWIKDPATWRRYQVPVVTHPNIKMRWPNDGVEVHLAPGFVYEVRFDRLHEVVNPTTSERIHIQIDTRVKNG